MRKSLRLRPLAQSSVQKVKVENMKRVLPTFNPPDMFQHIHDLKRTFVFGKSQYIGGLTTNTADSGYFTKSIIKEAEAQYLILGNFNNYHLSQYTGNKPQLIVQIKDLFCKDQFSQYLSESQTNPQYKGFYNSEDNLFYQIDERYQQIWTNDYMTAGINSLENDQTKVLYGSPSTIVTIQDIMLRFQLRQLQQIYSKVINYIKTEYRDCILYNPRIIQTWIRQVTLQQFKNTLHTKSMFYTASLFRNCAKLGKSNLLLCHKHLSNQIRHFTQRSDSNTDSIYRGYLKDNSHQDAQLYAKTMRQSTKGQLLQKFYLASQLIDNTAIHSLQRGFNIFRESIFSKKFLRMSSFDILTQMMNKTKKYKQQLLDVQTHFITNNLTICVPQKSKRLFLDQQLQLLEERKQNFPVLYETFSQKYDKLQEQQMQKIESIMQDYLKSENRLRDLQLLQQFRKKQFSKQNIILHTKLLGQLKIRSGSPLKLPLHHFKQFRGYYKQIMRDIILQQKYGVKKVSSPQEPMKIEVKQTYNIQQIQQLLKNSQFNKDKSVQIVNFQEELKNWRSQQQK